MGLLASETDVDGFISLAGAGTPIDQIILEQISKTAPFFKEDTKRVLETLKRGETTTDFPPALASMFNLEIQPFMSNWMQYNPQALIKNLDIIITPDTSISHIASAFNKPIVSIHENNLNSYKLFTPTSSLSKTVFATEK